MNDTAQQIRSARAVEGEDVRPTTGIFASLTDLERTADALGEQVSMLADLIGPCLRPRREEGVADRYLDTLRAESPSDVAERVAGITARVRVLCEAVDDLRSRFDL